MTKFRDGFIGPIVILCAICLVITLAVAATNEVTAPLIAEIEQRKSDEARQEVLSDGDSFTEVTGVELPNGVLEAHVADNGAGYVFKSQSSGFDGMVTFMVGIDSAGNIAGINMFDHSETPGQGTRVGEEEYLSLYYGTNNPDSVDAISMVTYTSRALKNSLAQALEAYLLVSGS